MAGCHRWDGGKQARAECPYRKMRWWATTAGVRMGLASPGRRGRRQLGIPKAAFQGITNSPGHGVRSTTGR